MSKEKIFSIKKIITENNSGKTKVILLYKNRDVIVPVSPKQDIYVNINDNYYQKFDLLPVVKM